MERAREVGVVGDGALADRVQALAEDATVRRGPAGEVLASDPEAVLAVGESALLALVREGLDVPVLPVDAGPGYGGVEVADESALTGAVERLVAGDFAVESRGVLGVSVGGERVGRALADVMLVTTEPARISEYAVRARDEQVERFRADGVVVSTPTGSHGYGQRAGCPRLEIGSGVVGVVPVAPFAVNVERWILSADRPVTLTVERDEGEVSLLLDDRRVRSIPPRTPVEVVEDDPIAVARVAESRPRFE